MAYNTYQPLIANQQSAYGWPANNQIMPQAQPISQQQPQPQQQATGALIPVPDEEFARSYPVAYGQSVSFRDETKPYIYTKTMGFSQMEPPIFKKYKLAEEPIANGV